MTRHQVVATILCVVTIQLLSQTVSRFGYKEGLNDENIIYINQDDRGVLWIASGNGSITIYDGWEFKQVPTREMSDVLSKGIKNISIINDDTLVVTNNAVIIIENNLYSVVYKGLIRSAINKGDTLLFVDEHKNLNIFTHGTNNTLKFSEKIESILHLKSSAFVLSSSKKLFQLGKEMSLKFIYDFGQSQRLNFQNYSIFLKEVSLIAIPVELLPEISVRIGHHNVGQIVEESRGRAWVLSQGELALFDIKSGINQPKAFDFTSDEVNCIFKDFEDNIWAGTTGGLLKIHQNKFQYAGSIRSRDRVTTINKGWGKQLIVGTERGKLYSIEGMKLLGETRLNVLIDAISGSHFDPAGKILLLGTESNGLLKVNEWGEAKRLINSRSIDNSSLQIFRDDKEVWVSSRNKILKVPKESTKPFEDLVSNLNSQSILAVDTLSIGSIVVLLTEGIYKIQNGKIRYDSIIKINLRNQIFTSFEIENDERYWIGTWGNGILMIDARNKQQRVISRIDGLNSDIVVNLLEIEGNIYVGTPQGIDLVSIGNRNVAVRHLSNEITPTNQNSFHYDPQSSLLWFGSNAKCYYYNVESEFKKPPVAVIESATFFGQNLQDPKIQALVQSPKAIQLRYNKNNAEFRFNGISLSYPEGVTYATRLLGRDSSWTYPGKERIVRFHDLTPGEYKFQVIAYSPEGITNFEKSSVEFSIMNPAWKDPWIIFGSIVILLPTGWVALKLLEKRRMAATLARENHEQEVTKQIRKSIARDFHDNIGNKLAGLKLTSNLIRLKLKGENQEVSNLLVEIEKSSQDLFDGTKDFIWSIDPESDNLIEVFTYLKDFGDRFFDRTHFTFYSNLKSTTNSLVKIPTGWSRQMVMIFKEAMTNTVKHSKGNTVTLQLDIKNNQFDFSYSDNGGYDGSRKHSGRGMKNMVDRANSINCHINYYITNSRTEVILLGALPLK